MSEWEKHVHYTQIKGGRKSENERRIRRKNVMRKKENGEEKEGNKKKGKKIHTCWEKKGNVWVVKIKKEKENGLE